MKKKFYEADVESKRIFEEACYAGHGVSCAGHCVAHAGTAGAFAVV